jgi:hypothetical protein
MTTRADAMQLPRVVYKQRLLIRKLIDTSPPTPDQWGLVWCYIHNTLTLTPMNLRDQVHPSCAGGGYAVWTPGSIESCVENAPIIMDICTSQDGPGGPNRIEVYLPTDAAREQELKESIEARLTLHAISPLTAVWAASEVS